MYIAEPVLNTLLRRTMRSVLRFSPVPPEPVPRKPPEDTDSYLLYLHVPFCETLCPYCSFHRYVYEEATAQAYFDALLKELHLYKEQGYDFKGIYVGGGTPTILTDRLVETLELSRRLFSIREISVETNPNHLTPSRLRLLRNSGVNRLSVGVQSFDDNVLKLIGRAEKYGTGKEILNKLREAAGIFDTLNVDLMFNLPVQSEASLRRDLDIVGALLPEQVTWYPLMTAPSVAAALAQRVGAVNYRTEKSYYRIILNAMRRHYTGSTAWCFSRKESMIDEYIIHYNKYVGAGSGAFGYFNNRMYINTFCLSDYIHLAGSGQFPVDKIKIFTRRETLQYFLLMKLFGLSLDRNDPGWKAAKQKLRAELLGLKLTGCIRETPDAVLLTDRGKYIWVMAMREFFIAVDTLRDHCRNAAATQPTGES